MVINKPSNMVVHPGIGNYTGTLLNGVAHHLLSQNPDLNEEVLPRFGLVHRIDKNTTGLIVLAKTPEAASHLAKQFFNHTVERKYVAVVWGDMEQEEGTIVANIARHKSNRKMFDAYPEAIRMQDNFGLLPLHYACLNEVSSVDIIMSLVKLYPESILVRCTSD
jgi:23S rRNA pseudouridine1911/1915/1917 synthase